MRVLATGCGSLTAWTVGRRRGRADVGVFGVDGDFVRLAGGRSESRVSALPGGSPSRAIHSCGLYRGDKCDTKLQTLVSHVDRFLIHFSPISAFPLSVLFLIA